MESRAPEISTIIVNWNTKNLLDRCLGAVFSTVRRSAEIIVVDNGSSDGSADFVAKAYPSCTLIRNRRNSGYAEANNQGFRAARGKYILLLNSDAAPQAGCVDGMAEFLDNHPLHGAAACRLVNEDGSPQPTYRRFPTLLALLAAHTSLRYLDTGKRQLERWIGEISGCDAPHDVDQPAAACLMIRREVIMRVGLLDTGCSILYNDVDLCRRIRAAGYRIAFIPHLRAIHTGGASCGMLAEFEGEQIRNVLHYVRKHYGPFASWSFTLLVWADRLRSLLRTSKGR